MKSLAASRWLHISDATIQFMQFDTIHLAVQEVHISTVGMTCCFLILQFCTRTRAYHVQ